LEQSTHKNAPATPRSGLLNSILRPTPSSINVSPDARNEIPGFGSPKVAKALGIGRASVYWVMEAGY